MHNNDNNKSITDTIYFNKSYKVLIFVKINVKAKMTRGNKNTHSKLDEHKYSFKTR